MSKTNKTSQIGGKKYISRPALTLEDREKQLISLAVDVAEEQLRSGTASAQVITHFLKLGTTYAELEKEKLRRETELLKVKAEMPQQNKYIEELCIGAIDAMKRYSGVTDDENN